MNMNMNMNKKAYNKKVQYNILKIKIWTNNIRVMLMNKQKILVIKMLLRQSLNFLEMV
jgi:hypothetical protein